jgi:gliding motility-associated-like protein
MKFKNGIVKNNVWGKSIFALSIVMLFVYNNSYSQNNLIRNGNFNEYHFPLSPQKDSFYQYFYLNWVVCKDWYSCSPNATHGRVLDKKSCNGNICGDEYTQKSRFIDTTDFTFAYYNKHFDSVSFFNYCKCLPCNCYKGFIYQRNPSYYASISGSWIVSDSAIIVSPNISAALDNRIYFGTQLKQKLIIGKSYKLKFYAESKNNNQSHSLGIAFTTYKAQQKRNERLNIKPQYQQNQYFLNSTKHPCYEFSFVADSAFEYLTVGCFLKNSEIHRNWIAPIDGYQFNQINYIATLTLDSFSLAETLIAPKIKGKKWICNAEQVSFYSSSGFNTKWHTNKSLNTFYTGDSIKLLIDDNTTVYATHDGFIDSFNVFLVQAPKNVLNDTFTFNNTLYTANYPLVDSFKYQWDNVISDTFNSKNYTIQGKYFVRIQSSHGCYYLDSFYLKNIVTKFKIIGDSNHCQFTPFKLHHSWGHFPLKWFSNESYLKTDSILEINPQIYGQFQAIACIDTLGSTFCDTFNYTIDQFPSSDLAKTHKVCYKESLEICVNVLPQFSLSTWSDGDTQLCKVFSTPNQFILNVQNGKCESFDTMQIIVKPLPRFTIVQNDTPCLDGLNFVELKIQPDSFVKYLWEPMMTNSNELTVYDTNTIKVTALGSNGCKSVEYYNTLSNCKATVFFPNTFTPNNDNHNEVFKIYGHHIKKIELQIFNRWGELVFVSNDINQTWDGTYQGEIVPQGQYVVKLKVTSDQIYNQQTPISFYEFVLNVLR